ncbi:zinc ribbon domain-containing protein [Natronorubrum sp. JWXQ-INN-674]|uniref:Zinc ribbon domain-containing protein n=1 Tax=Natronorubrum halalkaliphilum TaxID=2691917 RepID=A0A6B0VGN9_9EURY|nr:zinc ribbon domain-containing protein [Natronorubrum halalkaliphilum]MXV60971.1 zinc ribbon domain-containing protein [Natronorubrum halalkaliphilum]
MKVRYYADAEVQSWHEHTIRLLRTIHDERGLSVEIDRIDERYSSITDFPGKIRYPTPEAVYERDLKRNRDLTERIDHRPSDAYKPYGNFDIAGNIALVDEEGTVQWASTLPGYADGYGPDAGPHTSLDFLEDIAISPSNRVCVECLQLLDGDETFCPNCGYEPP